jgi:hypothetical protein
MVPEYAKYSPGSVLESLELPHAYARGFRTLCLGVVNDNPHFAYKKRWLTHREDSRKLVIVRPWSCYGLLDALLEKCDPARRLWLRFDINGKLRWVFAKLRRLRRQQNSEPGHRPE